jgi:predicted Zn-dependent protease
VTEEEALAILGKALKLASADGVTATLTCGDSAATRVADNAITQNVRCSRAGLRVECAYGQSHGAAATEEFSSEALKAVVERAQAIAKVSPPDPEYMPPVEAGETAKYPYVSGYSSATAAFSAQDKAAQLATAAREVAAAGLRLSGGYPTSAGFTAVANSAGLLAHHASTDAELHLTVLGPSGSGWAEAVSHNCADIAPEMVADRALDIAVRAQNPAPLEPGKYTVIMSAPALAELLINTVWGGFDAKATDEERTFLRGKLGARLCDERITIRSDPADARCPGAPFQNDGLASPTLPWIEKGVVKNLFHSRYWAKKQGKAATGWPSNVIMDGGDASVEQMIESTERGLLITRFWYIRYVDPMIPLFTGMTRDGLFLIENGKVARPVQNMRFNENMVDVLNRVEMLGPATRTSDMPLLVPAVKVREFNFTSGTKF